MLIPEDTRHIAELLISDLAHDKPPPYVLKVGGKRNPPAELCEFAEVAANSGFGPREAIARLLSNQPALIPDNTEQFVSGDRAKVTLCRSEAVQGFISDLFHTIADKSPVPVKLCGWDLYHAHLFAVPSSKDLGLLFHAKEFPEEFTLSRTRIPPVGHVDAGGTKDPRLGTECSIRDAGFPLRNFLWTLGSSAVWMLDPRHSDFPRSLLQLGAERFFTIDAACFGTGELASVNYFVPCPRVFAVPTQGTAPEAMVAQALTGAVGDAKYMDTWSAREVVAGAAMLEDAVAGLEEAEITDLLDVLRLPEEFSARQHRLPQAVRAGVRAAAERRLQVLQAAAQRRLEEACQRLCAPHDPAVEAPSAADARRALQLCNGNEYRATCLLQVALNRHRTEAQQQMSTASWPLETAFEVLYGVDPTGSNVDLALRTLERAHCPHCPLGECSCRVGAAVQGGVRAAMAEALWESRAAFADECSQRLDRLLAARSPPAAAPTRASCSTAWRWQRAVAAALAPTGHHQGAGSNGCATMSDNRMLVESHDRTAVVAGTVARSDSSTDATTTMATNSTFVGSSGGTAKNWELQAGSRDGVAVVVERGIGIQHSSDTTTKMPDSELRAGSSDRAGAGADTGLRDSACSKGHSSKAAPASTGTASAASDATADDIVQSKSAGGPSSAVAGGGSNGESVDRSGAGVEEARCCEIHRILQRRARGCKLAAEEQATVAALQARAGGPAWVVLVGGETGSTMHRDRARTRPGKYLGSHTSLQEVGRAYRRLVPHVGREHIIVMVQLQETLDWLRAATASEAACSELAGKGSLLGALRARLEATERDCAELLRDGGADYDAAEVNPARLLSVLRGDPGPDGGKVVPREGVGTLTMIIASHGNAHAASCRNDEWYCFFPYPAPVASAALYDVVSHKGMPDPPDGEDEPWEAPRYMYRLYSTMLFQVYHEMLQAAPFRRVVLVYQFCLSGGAAGFMKLPQYHAYFSTPTWPVYVITTAGDYEPALGGFLHLWLQELAAALEGPHPGAITLQRLFDTVKQRYWGEVYPEVAEYNRDNPHTRAGLEEDPKNPRTMGTLTSFSGLDPQHGEPMHHVSVRALVNRPTPHSTGFAIRPTTPNDIVVDTAIPGSSRL